MWFMIAATLMQAYSSYRQGKAGAEQALVNRETSRHNMLLAERDRIAALRETDEAQMSHLFQSEQAIGAARVKAGGSGARTDIGAPFRERAQMAAWLDFERMNIGREGRGKAEDFEQESASQYMLSKAYGKAAKNSMLTGYLGAGAAILGGYAKARGMGMGEGGGKAGSDVQTGKLYRRSANTKLYRTH